MSRSVLFTGKLSLESKGGSRKVRPGGFVRSLIGVVISASGILTACQSPVPAAMVMDDAPAAVAPGEVTPLGPNDVLHVGVYGHPELSSPDTLNGYGSRVDPEGNLNLPLVGGVQVAGLSVTEATSAVTAAFAAFVQDPRVHVTVVEWGSRRFYVFGEVAKPGPQVLDRALNAYQGLSLGGGFTRFADRDEVWLLRPEPSLSPERYVAYPIEGSRPSNSGLAALQPEDVLFVRRTGTGRFADEILPVLTGISSSLSSVATVLLIEDRLDK